MAVSSTVVVVVDFFFFFAGRCLARGDVALVVVVVAVVVVVVVGVDVDSVPDAPSPRTLNGASFKSSKAIIIIFSIF